MNCNPQGVVKFDLDNLPIAQRLVLKPALTVLQLGASFYLSELVKPVILPVFLLSVAVVFLFILKSRNQSSEYATKQSSQAIYAPVPLESPTYDAHIKT